MKFAATTPGFVVEAGGDGTISGLSHETQRHYCHVTGLRGGMALCIFILILLVAFPATYAHKLLNLGPEKLQWFIENQVQDVNSWGKANQ